MMVIKGWKEDCHGILRSCRLAAKPLGKPVFTERVLFSLFVGTMPPCWHLVRGSVRSPNLRIVFGVARSGFDRYRCYTDRHRCVFFIRWMVIFLRDCTCICSNNQRKCFMLFYLFNFQHRSANSSFLSPHITYRRGGENFVIYQSNPCWVITSVTLMTSLTEKALILQRGIWGWSLLARQGLTLALANNRYAGQPLGGNRAQKPLKYDSLTLVLV